MSQITNSQALPSNKKAYHSPQLRCLGKVSDITSSNGSGSIDDGSGAPFYAS